MDGIDSTREEESPLATCMMSKKKFAGGSTRRAIHYRQRLNPQEAFLAWKRHKLG
ncbi:hypothetical protein IF1G_04266 [Cordyceps javanica]|uniref:Uncharacterized protein n=1 Tax=Cordyceps javanica TaxID=43265 RepID=A0A545V5N8_9HYPO|nr:hypothetical protein IF1G_04266 [Cordyceps javanica]